MKTIFIASDHAGYNLKTAIIKKYSKKLKIMDMGTSNSKQSVMKKRQRIPLLEREKAREKLEAEGLAKLEL